MSISVLIPTYNRQQQVVRAIDSVLARTLTVDEIIVVDDGSTDGTFEVIHAQDGSQVTLIRQQNKGSQPRECERWTRRAANGRHSWIAMTCGYPPSWIASLKR